MNIPIITEPRCRCCTSRHRLLIERALIDGRFNFSAIARLVPPNIDGRRVTRRSVANHYYKHLEPVLMRVEARLSVEALENEIFGIHHWNPLPTNAPLRRA